MKQWLYAVMAECALPEEARGASGARLARFEGHGLQLVCEPCVDHLVEPTTAAVLAHGRVVQGLCASLEALPFRYGSVVTDERALAALLERRCSEWRKRLDVVRGHVELIVHVPEPLDRPSPEPSRTGTSYLAARARALRLAGSWSEELTARLKRCCAELRPLRGRSESVRLACLARPEARPMIEAEMAAWQSAHSGAHPRLTGPWPPLSFAEEASGR